MSIIAKMQFYDVTGSNFNNESYPEFAVALDSIVDENGVAKTSRFTLFEVISNRDGIDSFKYTLSFYALKSNELKNIKTVKSDYNKEKDPTLNEPQEIDSYSGHHGDGITSGRIINFEEINKILSSYPVYYYRKVDVDVILEEVNVID